MAARKQPAAREQTAAAMDAGALRRRLAGLADAGYAAFMQKTVPVRTRPFLGVRLPQLRALARELSRRPDWTALYRMTGTPDSVEEQLLRGFLPAYACRDYAALAPWLARFVPTIDNWAVCDCCGCTFTQVRRDREAAWPYIMDCLDSREEYVQRFGFVMLLNHYATPELLPRVLDVLAGVRPTAYYAEMALAWALSVFFLLSPETVMARLRADTWPPAMVRLACRKILESLRTPEAWREPMRQLRQCCKSVG